jgi:hypothetical protein
MAFVNLYEETSSFLSKRGKTFKDVKYVALGDKKWTNVSKFIEIAKLFEYENDFGSVEVNFELKLVGDDFWIQREEYDGAESWVFLQHPGKPKEEFYKKIITDIDLAELYGSKHSKICEEFDKEMERLQREIQEEIYRDDTREEEDRDHCSDDYIPWDELYALKEEAQNYPDDDYDDDYDDDFPEDDDF